MVALEGTWQTFFFSLAPSLSVVRQHFLRTSCGYKCPFDDRWVTNQS